MKPHKRHALLTRRQVIWLTAGFTGSIALSACNHNSSVSNQTATSTTTPSTPTKTVSASMGTSPWLGWTPLYIAIEKGFFTKRGLELKLNNFRSNTEYLAAFAAGQLQGLTTTPMEILPLTGKGQDYRIVRISDTSRGADGILASKKIANLADFKGKKIGVEKGSTSYYFLLKVLKKGGLTEKDVQVVNLSVDGAAAAYQSGKVDIAVTYEPFLQKANQATKDGRVIYDTVNTPVILSSIYLFSTKFIESNPAAVQAFVDGIEEGKKFLESNKQEGLAIASKQLGITPAEVEEQLKGLELVSLEKNREMLTNPNSQSYFGKNLEDVAKFFVAQGVTKEVPKDISKLIDPKFVQAAS